MIAAAILSILVTMALAVIRALLGKTVYDRILAVNVFGTKTVLLIAALAFWSGRPDILDIALAYALINFIGVVAVLRYFEYGGDDSKSSRGEEEFSRRDAEGQRGE